MYIYIVFFFFEKRIYVTKIKIFKEEIVLLYTVNLTKISKNLYFVATNYKILFFYSQVQRLQCQLATDDIALTGLRFFSITRNFMLAVN